jgi:hypothetical protein
MRLKTQTIMGFPSFYRIDTGHCLNHKNKEEREFLFMSSVVDRR